MKAWWKWCEFVAEQTHKKFIATKVAHREFVSPTEKLPSQWEQLDAWVRPKLVDACPGDVKDWVIMRAGQGYVDDSHVVLFYLFKTFGPGGAEEKILIQQNILNPKVCTNAKAAQIELIKWEEHLKRNSELDLSPPDPLLAYRAMESIFLGVFDKADAMLQLDYVEK